MAAYGCLVAGQSPWVRDWTARSTVCTPALSVTQKRCCSCSMWLVALCKVYMSDFAFTPYRRKFKTALFAISFPADWPWNNIALYSASETLLAWQCHSNLCIVYYYYYYYYYPHFPLLCYPAHRKVVWECLGRSCILYTRFSVLLNVKISHFVAPWTTARWQ